MPQPAWNAERLALKFEALFSCPAGRLAESFEFGLPGHPTSKTGKNFATWQSPFHLARRDTEST